MNIPREKTLNQVKSTVTWLIMLGRFGRLLFSLAIIGIGVETLICSYVSSHSLGPHYKVVPVIPWLPVIPSLTYPVGAILILCGASLLFQRHVVVSSITLGVLMLLCGLAFDVPRRPSLMSAEWRTNVLEPIAIGSLALARTWIGRHSEMASQDELLSSCICAHRLRHRPLSGSHLHCQHGARLDSLAPVLDCLLRRSLYRRGRKLRHWIPAAVGGFRFGTDVRALDRNNSPAACSQLLAHPRRASRSGQVVGRVHCRSALGRLVGARARFAR